MRVSGRMKGTRVGREWQPIGRTVRSKPGVLLRRAWRSVGGPWREPQQDDNVTLKKWEDAGMTRLAVVSTAVNMVSLQVEQTQNVVWVSVNKIQWVMQWTDRCNSDQTQTAACCRSELNTEPLDTWRRETERDIFIRRIEESEEHGSSEMHLLGDKRA